ncbi:SDR family NAD(P)-dependent oxidoreductase, partial [Enhygromyxa salina]|uniref:SDR family NAD(P)-dependent oxidoreductase n=1 Tax=Enhygromyxa salina TaxID=215803 RepID=UPI0011BADABF
ASAPATAPTHRTDEGPLARTRAALREMIAERLDHPGQVSTTLGFYDLGLDSSDLLDLVARLETLLGTQLYPTLLFEHQSIDALSRWLVDNHGGLSGSTGAPPAKPTAEPTAEPAPVAAGPRYMQAQWRPTPPSPASAPTDGPLLLLYPPPEVASQVRPGTIVVTAGAGFADLGDQHFSVAADSATDLRELFSQLERRGVVPKAIVHVNTGIDPQALYRRLLALVQGLWQTDAQRHTRLLHVELACGHPEAHAVRAFAATLAIELPRLPLAVLEVDTWPTWAQLDAELAQASAGELVRLHAGSRAVLGWVDASLEATPGAEQLDLRQRCVIVTGAAGGLGRLFARALAASGASLVLSSRRPADPSLDALVQELEQLGAQAIYISADVREPADAEALVAAAVSRFGPIHAVIHAAGVIDDALIVRSDPERAAAVLGAKIHGIHALEQACADQPLAFMLLCSSLAAVIGNLGQANYAFANGYLDGFAHWRELARVHGQRQGRCIAIDWPLWREGGMHVDARAAARLADTGIQALSTSAGLCALAGAISGVEAGAWIVVEAASRAGLGARLGVTEAPSEPSQPSQPSQP